MILRKHWVPALGRLPLTVLTRERIKVALGEKSGGDFKPKRVKGIWTSFGRACPPPSRMGSSPQTPPHASGSLSIGPVRQGIVETFTRAELTTLLETAEREMRDAAYPIVLTQARAGLRIGEALTLRVNDLDFEGMGYGCGGRGEAGRRRSSLAASMPRSPGGTASL